MATYLVRCAEAGRDVQRAKLRRDLAAVIVERLPGAAIELAPGRLVVEAGPEAADVLAALPGVTSVSPCRRVAHGELAAAVVELASRRLAPGASFAIRVRHGGDRQGTTAREHSPALARNLGDAVAVATGARVDLARPDVAIGVELRGDEAFVFDRVIAGVDRTGPSVPRAPGEACFVADQMLGRLAAHLRLLGYDTISVYDLADSEVIRIAAAEGRILLTRDAALSRTQAVPAYFVAATSPHAQLAEVLEACELVPDPARYFTRCTLCNTPVEPVAEAAVRDDVPPGVRGRDLAFVRCPACAQVYWHGSHVERILANLAAAGISAAAARGRARR